MTLEFELEYTVKFCRGKLAYARVARKYGDDHDIQRGSNITVKVTRWTGTQITCNKQVGYTSKTGPAEAALVYAEILRQTTHPRKCTFRSAYVYLAKDDAGGNGKAPGGALDHSCDYVAVDRLIAADKPIIPATYLVGVEVAGQFTDIMKAYNKALRYKKGQKKIKISVPPWAKRAAVMEHELHVSYNTFPNDGAIGIHIRDEVKVYRFLLGEYCRALPLPGAFKDAMAIKGAVLISRCEDLDPERCSSCKKDKPTACSSCIDLSRSRAVCSKHVWDALEKLNLIVRSEGKQIVLLSGDPGSGKEIFGNAIHHGSLRSEGCTPQKLAVAGVSLSRLRETLFGSVGEKGAIVDGMIAMAKGGTLFLDEFDKASTNDNRCDFGSMLLRVLESNKYFPEKSLTERDVEDVNWILAGAFEKSKGKAEMPRDILSRYTDRLHLNNPVKEPGFAKAMFIYWHFVETARWLRDDKKAFLKLETDATFAGVIARWLLWGGQKADDKWVKASADPLLPGLRILELADAFEAKLLLWGVKAIESQVACDQSRIGDNDYWRSEALAFCGSRTLRQAATAVSRELRTLVVGMLGGKPKAIKETLAKPETTDKLMERVDDVLKLLSSG